MRRNIRLVGLLLCGAIALGVLAHLFHAARPSTEAVRLRNALLISLEPTAEVAWNPPQFPAEFKRDSVAPDPRFVEVVRLLGADRGDDMERALRLAGHLTENAKSGQAIQADTWTAYQQIRQGRGYCSDFTQVFIAMAYAADLPVREWGFSFDRFGGWGHAVVEIFDRQRQAWVFVDVFNNFHVVGSDGVPLSVAQWRRVLADGTRAAKVVTNGPGRPGFTDGNRLWDYYLRGIDGWYLWMGTNLQAYEAQPLVRLAGTLSRSLEQGLAIMTDVHPRILLLETPSNGAAIHAMQGLRQRLLIELPLLAFSGIAGLALILWRAGRAKREQGGNTPTVLLVGPLPPPSGGMANQCRQLREFLTADGVPVEFVQTNAPYRPEWVGKARGVRAAFRLLPYLVRTWVGLGRSDVVHVFANSGMAWYLFALPVLVLARVRQVPCIINYRGGEARQFFAAAPGWVRRSPGLATTIVVPSGYLAAVFREFGFACTVVPNIIDLARFRPPSADEGHGAAPHVVVTRNLEDIYDIPTALRAFTLICAEFPAARLTVAGSGPEEAKLRALAEALGLADRVHFSGRIDNREIPALYASASLMLNPSRVDNMPISILEALASGVPVVSTDVGGIPFVVVDKESALLVPAGDAEGMAAAALSVLRDPALRNQLTRNGFALVEAYSWDRVRASWMAVYARLAGTGEVTANA